MTIGKQENTGKEGKRDGKGEGSLGNGLNYDDMWTLKSHAQFIYVHNLLCRLIQNWWTRRKVRQEHGPERKISFPQWERDYNLQPMNAYGLFDEYLEMSMKIFYFILFFFILFIINANSSYIQLNIYQ